MVERAFSNVHCAVSLYVKWYIEILAYEKHHQGFLTCVNELLIGRGLWTSGP